MKVKTVIASVIAAATAGFFGWNAYVESRPIPPDVSCVAATVRYEGQGKKDETKRLIAFTLIEAAREENIPLCQYAREQRVTQRRANAHQRLLDVAMPELRPKWQVWAHSTVRPELEVEWRAAMAIAKEVLEGAWKPGGDLSQVIRLRSGAVISGPNATAFKEVPFLKDRQEFVLLTTVEGIDFYKRK